MDRKGEFADFILEQLQQAEEASDSETDTEHIWRQLEDSLGREEVVKRRISVSRQLSRQGGRPRTVTTGLLSSADDSDDSGPAAYPGSVSRTNSVVADDSGSLVSIENYSLPHPKGTGEALIEEEFAEVAGVNYRIYIYYGAAVGVLLSITGLLCYTLFQVSGCLS